jgi:adenosylhomocysteine nucleosidase
MIGAVSTIAFVCAMPMEVKPLVRRLALRRRATSGPPSYDGTLRSHRVVAVVTGMGTRLAAAGLERLLAETAVDRVVVVGITGALENETPIGALVLPEVVVDAASGVEHRPAALGAGRPAGAMWTSDTLTTDPAVLNELRARGVVALDMETAAIAAVCEDRGVPWSVFRAISDRASDGSVDEEVFRLSNQDGTPNPVAVLRYFLRHPARIPAMARMARGARRATETAADAAIAACAVTL